MCEAAYSHVPQSAIQSHRLWISICELIALTELFVGENLPMVASSSSDKFHFFPSQPEQLLMNQIAPEG
jgi:hypothetical protein